MGWFDEQIKQRKQSDDDVFADSFIQIAGAIMGSKVTRALNDDRMITKNAIDEILKFYHLKTREIPDDIKDMNEQLEFLLRPYGIMRRSVKLEKGWYKDAVGPMLGIRADDGSVVALIPDGISGYRFFDRSSGNNVKLNKKTEKMIQPEAICFYEPFPMKAIGIKDLIKYIAGTLSVSDIIMIAAAILAATLVGMLTPKLNRIIFSEIVPDGNIRTVVAMTVFMLSVSISVLFIGTIKDMLMARIKTKMDVSVEAATMMRVLSLPADFFKQYSAGELASRAAYVNSLCDMLVSSILSTSFTSLFSLIYIYQIFLYTPALVIPAVTVVLATLILSVIITVSQVNVSKYQMLLSSKENGMCYALITGIQKIKLAGAEKRAFARWGKLYSEEAKALYDNPLFLRVNTVLITAVSLIGLIVIYYEAVISGVSVADYYAFTVAYGMVSGAFSALASVATTVANIKPILDMAKPMLQTVPEISEEKHVISRLSGGIELNNVSFRYDDNMPLVIDDLSLKIRPGQYVAIVGATGCGKSTLMRILLGFERPQKGAVYYDGKDISTIDLKSLRRKIGAVMQDGKLFQGDIYSNIVISAPYLTLDDAWEAAEIAGVADDIRSMPMGMLTMISEGNGGISGGQRQRLMIARAIAPKPKILMFDEATSALDNLTQKKVSESLDNLKCTRIVIAHRLSTIKNCDRIVVIDHGKIIEDGTYSELMEKKGFFTELVERQKLEQEQ
ncbi:MAG: NHLP bacteriocin export ABC transporter permease/ATPase subunit [Lachnospira sp.]